MPFHADDDWRKKILKNIELYKDVRIQYVQVLYQVPAPRKKAGLNRCGLLTAWKLEEPRSPFSHSQLPHALSSETSLSDKPTRVCEAG